MVKKNIFLTGSNGYLGSIIKKKFKKKFNIIISQKDQNLKKFDNHAILHLAALNKNSCEKNKSLAYKINVTNTRKLINFSKKYNFKKIIFFSSIHVYGKQKSKIKENQILKPKNYYGITKKKSEEMLLNISRNTNIIILRISNVIAKPHKENEQSKKLIVNYLCRNILKANVKINSNGDDTRDFISINYLIDCLLFFLNRDKKGVFNLCSGQSISIKHICSIILRHARKNWKIKYKIIFGKKRIDKFDMNFSNSKISKLISKNSNHNLNDEIFRIIKFYKNKKTL